MTNLNRRNCRKAHKIISNLLKKIDRFGKGVKLTVDGDQKF